MIRPEKSISSYTLIIAMSRVTKLKHLKREDEVDDLSLPNDKQRVVRVVSSKGNNLHEVESASDEVS